MSQSAARFAVITHATSFATPQHLFDTIPHSSVLIFMDSSLNVCSLLSISVHSSNQRFPPFPFTSKASPLDLNFTCTVHFKDCATKICPDNFVLKFYRNKNIKQCEEYKYLILLKLLYTMTFC